MAEICFSDPFIQDGTWCQSDVYDHVETCYCETREHNNMKL